MVKDWLSSLMVNWDLGIALEVARDGGRLSWDQWFRLLAEVDEDDVNEVENLFSFEYQGELSRMAGQVVQEHRMQQDRFFADAHSTVHAEFVTMMRQVRTSGLEGVMSFRAVLKTRVSKAFSVFLESGSGLNPASGMSNIRRRRNAIHQTRVRMAADQVEAPTDEQIIEATNQRMLANRSDAKKQGMLVTVEDLAPIPPAVAFDPDIAPHLRAESEASIVAADRKALAAAVLSHPKANETELSAMIARYVWEHQLLDVPPPPVIARDLTRDFPDVDPRKLSRLFRFLQRELPKQILAERFGITGPN